MPSNPPAEGISPSPLPTEPILPGAVQKKILALRKLEITLGHIPQEENWQPLGDMIKRLGEDESQAREWDDMETQTEDLFLEICSDLTEQKWTPEAITQAINSLLFYSGGPKYCSVDEVKECLGIS